MDFKHSCVVDAEGYYKDLVLVYLEPSQPKQVLDMDDFGAAQITRRDVLDPIWSAAERLIAAEYRSGEVFAGEMEDGRILYYMTGEERPKAAVLIVDTSREIMVSFAGCAVERENRFELTDDETGGSIMFSLQEAPPEIVPVIQHYTLAEGERLIDTTFPTKRLHAGAEGFLHPRWDDDAEAWVEGASLEETAAWEAEHPAPEPVAPSVNNLEGRVATLETDKADKTEVQAVWDSMAVAYSEGVQQA